MSLFNYRLAPLSLFILYSLKLLVFGGPISEACVLFVLALCAFYYDYRITDKQMTLLEEKIDRDNHEIMLLKNEMVELRDRVNSVKLANHLKATK